MAIVLPTPPTSFEQAADDIRNLLETAVTTITYLRGITDDTYSPPSEFSPYDDGSGAKHLSYHEDLGWDGIAFTHDRTYGDEAPANRSFHHETNLMTGIVDPANANLVTTGTLTSEQDHGGSISYTGLLTVTDSGASNTTWDGTTVTGPLSPSDFTYTQDVSVSQMNAPDQVDGEFSTDELNTIKTVLAVVPETDSTKISNALSALA